MLQHSTAAPGRSIATLVEQVRSVETKNPSSYSDPYELRVLDRRGEVLAETRGMAQVPVQAFENAPVARPGKRVRPRRWSSADGVEYLIVAIDPQERSGRAEGSIVHVALNVTRDRVLLGQLRTIAILLLVGALIGAAVAGSAVVRFSLKPVGRIAAEVSEITARDLNRQLAVHDRPVELQPLVTAFNAVLDRLGRAFAGLSEYSENLAHELRTPLNNLKGEAEVALLHERSADEYREVLMSSLEEYDRLSNMADGLLFLARAESRGTRPAWEVVPLGDHARAVCEYYEGIAEEKEATLEAEGDASVRADPGLLRRALANLVANALAHVPPGGHVRISIASEPGGGASIRVADDGSGIPPQDLPHVLDRFYRGADTRGRGIQGSGLGLAIVKSIMDMHGGSIDIASGPAPGTTVTLLFPPAS